MTVLTCAVALKLVESILAEGRSRQLAPLTAAVLDAGGHVVALARDDGSSLLRPQIATGKAWGALGLGFGGRELAQRAAKMPAFFTAAIELADGKLVPVPGGVLIRDSQGHIVGAVGVTGDTSDNDEACAVAALAAVGGDLGLRPDTGA
ncbi:MAG: heme-binding protein [Azospirillaceae bacterium]|nr:heme-binding protein [Azospirillaceae bacterium]